MGRGAGHIDGQAQGCAFVVWLAGSSVNSITGACWHHVSGMTVLFLCMHTTHPYHHTHRVCCVPLPASALQAGVSSMFIEVSASGPGEIAQ